MKNADKRIAIVYYNHPPGRHNIGADNLDVPASLLEILRALKRDGYDTGALPASSAGVAGEAATGRRKSSRARRCVAIDGDARVTNVSTRSSTRKWFATMPRPLARRK